MQEVNILYAGCKSAGKSSSIEFLVFASDWYVVPDDSYEISKFWFHKKNYDLNLIRAKYSIGDYYLHKREENKSSSIKYEIELLKKIDAIIFFIDSDTEELERYVNSYKLLQQTFKFIDCDLELIPTVFQLDGRDGSDIASLEDLRKLFKSKLCSYVETVSHKGFGIEKTVNELLELVELSKNN